MPSHLAHFQWQQKDDASTNHKQESKCHLLIQMQQRHFFYINKLLKSKVLSSYLWKLCCFIHHIYTQDTAIKNAYELQNYKSYSLFLTIYTTKFVWSVKLLKGNLASAIKVTFEPSMAIHWSVLQRFLKTKSMETLLLKLMMKSIVKKK